MIIYCHGLGSSGRSDKANILRWTCGDLGVSAPDLPLEPEKAVQRIEAEIGRLGGEPCLLVGSSLGGFYALYLHQTRYIPAVLLNPATEPFQERNNATAMRQHIDLGNQWREQYTAQLRAMQVTPGEVEPHNLWVYLAVDDEVLDYRRAANYFAVKNCAVTILPDGGHRLTNFETLVPQIRSIYLGLKS